MPLSHRNFGTARVLAPKGRLDHESCEAFQADLKPHAEACAREGTALVLDLSGLEYVSSAGLRCLMLAARESKCRPDAASRARASLSRTSATVRPTGIEPRVPQKRTRMPASAALESAHGLRRD